MIIQGTNLSLLITALKNETEPYDLSDAEVTVIFQYPDSSNKLVKTAEVTDALQGRCQVQLRPTDLPEGGTCRYQVKVTFPDGTISRSAISSFYIADSLGE